MKHSIATILLLLATCTTIPAWSTHDHNTPLPATAIEHVTREQWQDRARNRIVPVKIYMPAHVDRPLPVVIFSHGLGGSRENARYLGEYWSAHGYVAVFVQHIGSDSSVWTGSIAQGRRRVLANLSSAINMSTFQNRVDDIKFILDELQRRNKTQGPLEGKLDLSRIAIAGHSYGGNTALTMVGQKYVIGSRVMTFTDPRIKAAIYLSPPANLGTLTPQQVFGQITVPGLLMTGTNDSTPDGLRTPVAKNKTPEEARKASIEQRRIPFDGITAPHQYLVTFDGGDHMIFNGPRPFRERPGDRQMISEIERVTTAFLDAYLRNDTTQQQWLDRDANKYLSDAKFERK
jgi:predicted dienelactone hydrolase